MAIYRNRRTDMVVTHSLRESGLYLVRCVHSSQCRDLRIGENNRDDTEAFTTAIKSILDQVI